MKPITNKKKRICGYVFLVAIVIILLCILPFACEWVIMEEKVFPFSAPISLSRETWFGFIGSYVGTIGSIMLGVIALWQNKALSDANKALLEIQEDFFVNMTNPILRLSDELTFVYENRGTTDVQKLIKNSVDTCYPVICANIYDSYQTTKCWYTTMKLPVENHSDIALSCFKINSFAWTINDVEYSFRCDAVNQKSRTTLLQKYNLLNICLIYPDMMNEDEEIAKCGKDIQCFIEAPQPPIGTKGRIKMEIEVVNQVNRCRTYSIDMVLVKSGKMAMQISEYLIYAKEDTQS